MKKLIMICASVVLMAVFGSTAKATTVNPANWTFTLETHENGAPPSQTWISDSNVPKDFPQYDYDWELTEAKLWVEWGVPGWLDILDSIPEGDKSGSGTEYELPFNIRGPSNPISIGLTGLITADIYLGVLEEGYGSARITNIILGQAGGKDVTGAKFGGQLNVTAVPEPATVLLLGLGSLVFLRKHRKNIWGVKQK